MEDSAVIIIIILEGKSIYLIISLEEFWVFDMHKVLSLFLETKSCSSHKTDYPHLASKSADSNSIDDRTRAFFYLQEISISSWVCYVTVWGKGFEFSCVCQMNVAGAELWQ